MLYFDYDVLMWRFDPLEVQAHLSDAGVDAYLHRIQSSLPPLAKEFLQVLSCLPVSGVHVDFLAAALGAQRDSKEAADVGPMIAYAQIVGAVTLQGSKIRFSHDRQRVSLPRCYVCYRPAKGLRHAGHGAKRIVREVQVFAA